jgi:hypothetical protein
MEHNYILHKVHSEQEKNNAASVFYVDMHDKFPGRKYDDGEQRMEKFFLY